MPTALCAASGASYCTVAHFPLRSAARARAVKMRTWRGVGVPGCEAPSTYDTHFQAGQQGAGRQGAHHAHGPGLSEKVAQLGRPHVHGQVAHVHGAVVVVGRVGVAAVRSAL